MKKVAVIYNPVSGRKFFSDTAKSIQEILKYNKVDFTWIETKKSEKQNFYKLKKHNFDRIFIAGGDGTISFVASFCIKNKIKSPIVILPFGSANLLARSLRLPLFNLRKSIENGLRNDAKSIDAILVNQKYYGFVAAGTGYDAMLMLKTSRTLKKYFGFLAYVLVFIFNYYFYKSKEYILTLDNKKIKINAKSVLICNIIPFCEFEIVKNFLKSKIHINDGKLNIFIFNPKTFFDLLKLNQHIESFEAKKIIVYSKKQKRFQMDGELYKSKDFEIDLVPNALNIIY